MTKKTTYKKNKGLQIKEKISEDRLFSDIMFFVTIGI